MNACLFSTWHEEKKFLKHFLASAQKHGMEPVNADDSKWDGFHQKVIAQHRFVKVNASQFTHFIWADAYDVVFMAGLDEMMRRFNDFDLPIVFAAEANCWPKQAQADHYPTVYWKCRFLNAGFWIAESKAALAMLEAALPLAVPGKCDQGLFVDLFLSGLFPIKLDYAASLCRCLFLNPEQQIDSPCCIHGNGKVDLEPYLSG